MTYVIPWDHSLVKIYIYRDDIVGLTAGYYQNYTSKYSSDLISLNSSTTPMRSKEFLNFWNAIKEPYVKNISALYTYLFAYKCYFLCNLKDHSVLYNNIVRSVIWELTYSSYVEHTFMTALFHKEGKLGPIT